MDTFVHSSFGTIVMALFHSLFTAPSWHTFAALACDWALATDRHTITTYVWLTGATTLKHFSRFYVFLGCPLYHRRWQLWCAIIRLAVQFVPEGEVIRVSFDDTTKKKAGTQIEGLARYRNSAGSARQEYRTLRGLNFGLGVMHIPLKRWPGHSLSIPVGLERYLKESQARKRNVPYRSRSQLARDILDFMAAQVPGRPRSWGACPSAPSSTNCRHPSPSKPFSPPISPCALRMSCASTARAGPWKLPFATPTLSLVWGKISVARGVPSDCRWVVHGVSC